MPYLAAAGSCCAPCAKSGTSCATGLGATKSLVHREIGIATLAQAQVAVIAKHRMLTVGVLGGAAALGALYLARRKR